MTSGSLDPFNWPVVGSVDPLTKRQENERKRQVEADERRKEEEETIQREEEDLIAKESEEEDGEDDTAMPYGDVWPHNEDHGRNEDSTSTEHSNALLPSVGLNTFAGSPPNISAYPTSDSDPDTVSPANNIPASTTFAARYREANGESGSGGSIISESPAADSDASGNSASKLAGNTPPRSSQFEAGDSMPELPRTNYLCVMARLDDLTEHIRRLSEQGRSQQQDTRILILSVQSLLSQGQGCPCLRQPPATTSTPTPPSSPPATGYEAWVPGTLNGYQLGHTTLQIGRQCIAMSLRGCMDERQKIITPLLILQVRRPWEPQLLLSNQ
jgi:hypothetical protein